jgi:lipopolysaccharide transport system permease protein
MRSSIDVRARAANRRATASERRSVLETLRRRLDVLVALTQSDLRARYGRGAWRLLKWLADPFALVGIYLLLVTFVLERAGEAPGLSLACAVVPFQLVMMAVVNAMGAIQVRSSILLNMSFDRVLIPVSSVLTEAVSFSASLGLIGLMMAAYGVAPTTAVLWLPVVLLVTMFFAISCAYASTLLGLWFSDLRPFAISFVRALFFLAPGLIALPLIEGRAQEIVRVNPLTGLFESFRSVFLYGQRPAAWMLLVPVVAGALILAATLPLYRREQHHFAKVLG